MSLPEFVVVGRVNKGKSTIVSALTEDESVRIGPLPGTTRKCRRFEVALDGRPLLAIIDTPGFQDAAAALAWMQARERTAAERPEIVADFVRAHEGKPDFEDEVELLKPVLAGAAILYVVDGTVPFLGDYTAEMEILRWTGRPRLALFNPIEKRGDYTETWRRALDQYFSVVRGFDGQQAGFEERVQILEAFKQLREDGRPEIEQAIAAYRRDWEDRRRQAAGVIADFTAKAVRFYVDVPCSRGEAPGDAAYREALAGLEREARRRVEELYHFRALEVEEAALPLPASTGDLFSEQTWKVFGLAPQQLVLAEAVGGGLLGGTLDVAVGGASFLTGALLGCAGGAAHGLWMAWKRRPSIEAVLKQAAGQAIWRVGPHPDRQFFWILVDRALQHARALRDRSHGRRDKLVLKGLLRDLDRPLRQPLEEAASRLRKSELRPEQRAAFIRALESVLVI